MKALQRDSRGYPVPFNVLRDLDGKPHFAANDSAKALRCLMERRCAICGSRLGRDMWFVGGPLAALHEDGVYIDTPLHYECMTYALRVCPYLAAPRYLGRIDDAGIDYNRMRPEHQQLIDPSMIPERPSPFVAVCSSQMTFIKPPVLGMAPRVRPERPYSRIEFWEHGETLDYNEGMGRALERLKSYTHKGMQ
jgi:hypothetical protein